jgi:membrane-bound lytic murein transglycosylase D
MLRRNFYAAMLLISCSLINGCNIHKVSGTPVKNITATDAMISDEPVFTLPHLAPSDFELNPAALQYAEEYVRKNSWGLEKLKENSQSNLTVINSVFTKYEIPHELKYMAIVESNLNTSIVCNSTGATGIWQLMPVTARELGLEVNEDRDERLHVGKSSAAAAKYLKQLYTEFGDWLLVIAAYNAGPAKVTRAINLSGNNNFWQLENFLPAETRNHVKRFMSVLYFFEEENKTVKEQNA